MNQGQRTLYFFRNIREKLRLSLRNQHTDSELWYMHISPANIIASFIALVAILFIISTITVAYTPILNLLPGYSGNKAREALVSGIMRLDSLERQLNDMQLYSENISLIMAGKNPVTPTEVTASDSAGRRGAFTGRIAADSILRQQMESEGSRYSLTDPEATRRALRGELELFTPVAGVIVTGFKPVDNHYGITVGTAASQPVMAVLDGTVISAGWTPSMGYEIFIQHADNIISVYRNNASILKRAGERVRGGEVIGYTGSEERREEGVGNFEFELWHNSAAVDPQGYIVF